MTKEEISIQVTALGIRERIVSLLRDEADNEFSVRGNISVSRSKGRIFIGRFLFVEVKPTQVTFYRAIVESCPEFKQVKLEVDKFLESYYPNIRKRYYDGNIVS